MTATAAKLLKAKATGLRGTLAQMRKYWYCYVMISGTFALLILFQYYPAFSAFYHSFTIWDGFRPARWNGLANYREIFTSSVIFGRGFLNMMILLIWRLIIVCTAPLMCAGLLFHLKHAKLANFFRLCFVLPIVVPWVVRIYIWRQIYEPNFGLMNEILKSMGLESMLWLSSSKTVLLSIMFSNFPWIDAVSMLIYLAALLAINPEVIDAAVVDGATGWSRFWHVELPLVIPQLRLLIILSIIGGLQDFGWQLLVTQGGPNDASTVPAYEMYHQAMAHQRLGMASAIGVVLFLLILIATLVNNRLIRSNIEYQGM